VAVLCPIDRKACVMKAGLDAAANQIVIFDKENSHKCAEMVLLAAVLLKRQMHTSVYKFNHVGTVKADETPLFGCLRFPSGLAFTIDPQRMWVAM
jgi:hypothetical protein